MIIGKLKGNSLRILMYSFYTVWTVNVCFSGIHRESTGNPPSEKWPKLLVNPAHLKSLLKVDSRWIPTHFLQDLNIAYATF